MLLVEETSDIGGFICADENRTPYFHTDIEDVARFIRGTVAVDPAYPEKSQVPKDILRPFLEPINFRTIEEKYSTEQANDLKRRLTVIFKNAEVVSLNSVINCIDPVVAKFGRAEFLQKCTFIAGAPKIYIKHAVEWILNSIPVWLSNCEKLFWNRIQFFPENGYKEWLKDLVDSPYIDIKCNFDALDYLTISGTTKKAKYRGVDRTIPIVYTGSLDRLFGYKYGRLPYYKGCPLESEENIETVCKYRAAASEISNLYLCGRLAEYKFYFIDIAVARAMEVFSQIPLPVQIPGRTGEKIIESGDNLSKDNGSVSELIIGDLSREIPKVSIVIPTYHRAEQLREAMKSAIDQTVGQECYDIVVVDNEPKGDIETEKVIKDLYRPNVYYYRNSSNLGAYGNQNRSVCSSRSKWVCMLHDDDWLLPDAVQYAYEALQVLDNEKLGAVLPRRIDIFEDAQEVYYGRLNWRQRLRVKAIVATEKRYWRITEFDYYMFPYLYPAPSYGTLLNRDALIDVGGMAAEYPCEDGFFMLKLARKYNCYLCGQTWGKYRFAQNGGFRPYDLLQSVQAIQRYREYIKTVSLRAKIHQKLFGKAAYQLEIDGSVFWEHRMNGFHQNRMNYQYAEEFQVTEKRKEQASFIKKVWEVYTLFRGVAFGIHTPPHKMKELPQKQAEDEYMKHLLQDDYIVYLDILKENNVGRKKKKKRV